VGEFSGSAGDSPWPANLRQAEIQQLDHALWCDLRIGGFQIAMNDAFVVRVFKRSGNLRCDMPSLVERHGPFGRLALDQLHHQRAIFNAVNVSDVWVIQPSKDLGFALEARQSLWVAGEGFRQNLERHVALQLGIPRAVYLAHTSRADECEDFVGTEFDSRRHLFNPAVQFKTTVMGVGGGSPLSVFTRNRLPSRERT
jgi:hypothetical protein